VSDSFISPRPRGLTLVEVLIATAMFLIVLAGALAALGGQTRGFNRGADEMRILQNLRYGVDQLEQELRIAGANVPDDQPPLIYAGPTAFSFNADLVSNLKDDISAVYIDVTAPSGWVSALRLADAITIPGSNPGFTYPGADFETSPAETISFWFTPDAETGRGDDFVLMRQVNNRNPEPLVRNILAPADGGAFFRYRYLNTPQAGNPTLEPVPAAWLPLRHIAPRHGVLPDTGVNARIDLLRTVEVRYRVTNGLTGPDQRIRPITTIIALPNVGVKKLKSCGSAPLFGQPVTANLQTATGGVRWIEVSWPASVDDLAGEEDVIRYVIWRRSGGAGPWGDPRASIPAGQGATYVYPDRDIVSGASYQYAVAAQDCTPTLSVRSFSTTVPVP
jgi:prepilin-type N-terminal cleavage/methylation domain-containing protein